VVGFDIDIAEALCAEMAVDCALRPTEWDAIIPALEAGRCDAIIASMAITEARRQRVAFSEKYQQAPIVFVAPEGSDFDGTPADAAGRRICVQRGTVHQDFAETRLPGADLALYPTQEEAFLDLGVGRCDAAMADAVAAEQGFLETEAGAGFAIVGEDLTDPAIHGAGAGVAVRKDEPALADRFSEAIAAIRRNGVYAEINDRYFGFDVYGR
jgi:polar amino acid transport system substrate-binding protein/arginine/ornithine transport system substrate-binding protein